jgi:hypothetical protein
MSRAAAVGSADAEMSAIPRDIWRKRGRTGEARAGLPVAHLLHYYRLSPLRRRDETENHSTKYPRDPAQENAPGLTGRMHRAAQIESIGEIHLQQSPVRGDGSIEVVGDEPANRMHNYLRPTFDSNTKLERRQESLRRLAHPGHETLGHQAADDLSDSNGTDSAIWLNYGSQGRTAEPRGKRSGRPPRSKPIHKVCNGIRCQGRSLGRRRMEHVGQVRMAETRSPRGGPAEEARQCGFDL